MKYSFSLALLILLFLMGCKTQHVAYHSTASVPYFSEATTTHLEVIVGSDDFAGDRDFVVYHAVDNGADAYTLIAPSTDRARENNEFQRGRIHRAVPRVASTRINLPPASRKRSGCGRPAIRIRRVGFMSSCWLLSKTYVE